MYQIIVERRFRAAHALRLPDGSRERSHRHTWRVRATVAARRLDGIETVMDFHELERMLAATLAPLADADLNRLPPFADGPRRRGVNPSAERVAWWIGRQLRRKLPRRVRLDSVAVTEAPGCQAVWRP